MKTVVLIILIGLFGCTNNRTKLTGIVKETYDKSVLLELNDSNISDIIVVRYDEKIKFNFDLRVGQTVEFTCSNEIMESYPPQINCSKVKLVE